MKVAACRYLALIGIAGLVACSQEDPPTAPASGAALFAVAGDGQSVYLSMGIPLTVALTGASESPVVGVEVQFALVEGDGRLTAGTAVTDRAGQASTQLLVGDTPGPVVVQATAGDPPISILLTATTTRYPRVAPAEVVDLLSAVSDSVSARGAVRAALASAGCTLLDGAGGELTSAGGKLALSPTVVDSLAQLELRGLRQTLAEFHVAFRASGYSIRDTVAGPMDAELFVESLRSALDFSLAYREEPASYLVLGVLSGGTVVDGTAAIGVDTELSPVQSFLLLLALADVAHPSESPGGDAEAGPSFFSGTTTFPMGLVVAGGLIFATGSEVTVAAPTPGALVAAVVGEEGFGPFLEGAALTLGRGRRLEVKHATVASTQRSPTVVVVERGEGTSRNFPPAVYLGSPWDGREYWVGGPVTLTGTAIDREDGNLGGAALVWRSDRDGLLGTGELERVYSLSVGAHTITLTATDSEGWAVRDSVSITVRPANLQPVAAILQPADGSEFVEGTEITLRGTGTDPEEGELTGHSLLWFSSLDGSVGTGATVTIAWLRPGQHTIALRAKDRETSVGRAPADTVVITVTPRDTTSRETGTERTFELLDGYPMDFVWIGSGYYMMGGDSGDPNTSLRRHRVRISRGDLDGEARGHPGTVAGRHGYHPVVGRESGPVGPRTSCRVHLVGGCAGPAWAAQRGSRGRGVSPAHRGGVGVRLPRRDGHHLVLRQRWSTPGPVRLVQPQRGNGSRRAPGGHQAAQPLGPPRHARQRVGMGAGLVRYGSWRRRRDRPRRARVGLVTGDPRGQLLRLQWNLLSFEIRPPAGLLQRDYRRSTGENGVTVTRVKPAVPGRIASRLRLRLR